MGTPEQMLAASSDSLTDEESKATIASTAKTTSLRWRTALIMVLVLGLAWIWISQTNGPAATQSRTPAPALGHPAPDFVLKTPEGTLVRLRELRGQAVILNFWASWCGPCRAEMPAFQSVYTEYKGKGLTILAVNQGESLGTVTSHVRALNLTFPILLDDDWHVSTLYNVRALPTSFFIDRKGIIRAVIVGAMNGPLLESNVRRIVP